MAILLGAQMAVRLALLWVLLVLSGPGLACFALPQTVGFGRMWLSPTAKTVLVQFFQVVTLALGGMLVTSLGASNLFGVGGTLATLLVCVALLYLILASHTHPDWSTKLMARALCRHESWVRKWRRRWDETHVPSDAPR